jgi:glycosyltransferase involved in cell wall biosynthesis
VVVSVYGDDLYGPRTGNQNVAATLAKADLVLVNSAGTATRSQMLGARETRVVHLGTDLPSQPPARPPHPVLVTVAHLAERKRHADVIQALALLCGRHPGLRYVIVGDGPERQRLQSLAQSLVVDDLVEFRGELPPRRAVAAAWGATLFVLRSVDEAFGVAYVEAMARGVVVIGGQAEPGPEESAAAGDGIVLVPPKEPRALAVEIGSLLRDPARLQTLGQARGKLSPASSRGSDAGARPSRPTARCWVASPKAARSPLGSKEFYPEAESGPLWSPADAVRPCLIPIRSTPSPPLLASRAPCRL